MLLKLLLFRLGPLLGLKICKSRKSFKMAFGIFGLLYVILFLIALRQIFGQEKWFGVWCLLISIFPHYLCYVFGFGLMIRCVWNSWSERVWKRIYKISFLITIVGILIENYWSPKILHFFTIFYNNFFGFT